MLTILLCTLFLDPPATQPVDNRPLEGRIAFISNRIGNNDIYTMNPDGSDVRRITKTSANEDWPRWSPDGRQIVFIRGETGSTNVWLMNADGSNQTQLTDTDDATHPTWSPDGKKLALRREPVGHGDIYIYDFASKKMTQLTEEDADEWGPSWSPDGKWIVFAHAGKRQDIDIIEVATKKRRTIVAERGEDSLPMFSPDGKHIICNTHPNGVATELFLTDPQGKESRRLTFTSDEQQLAFNFGASFSPCGREVVFTSGRDQNFELYRLNLKTGDSVRLTKTLARDTRAHWGPAATAPAAK